MQSSDQPPFENPEGPRGQPQPDNPFANSTASFDSKPNPFMEENPFGGKRTQPEFSEPDRFDEMAPQTQYVPTFVSTPTGYELRFQLRSTQPKYVGPIVPPQDPVVQLGERAATAVTSMVSQAGRVVGTSFLTALQFAVTKFFIEWMAGMTRATIQSAADKGLPVQRIDTADIVYSPGGQATSGSQSNQNSHGRNPADSPFGAPPRVW